MACLGCVLDDEEKEREAQEKKKEEAWWVKEGRAMSAVPCAASDYVSEVIFYGCRYRATLVFNFMKLISYEERTN